jgi:hypothetical protein
LTCTYTFHSGPGSYKGVFMDDAGRTLSNIISWTVTN